MLTKKVEKSMRQLIKQLNKEDATIKLSYIYCIFHEMLPPIPPERGIYLLISQNSVMYIGKAQNIKTRVRTHKNDYSFNEVIYILCEDEIICNCVEYAAIVKFKPRHNKNLVNSSKASNYRSIEIARHIFGA